MDIIVGGRETGKTVELIKRCAETGAVIFVLTYQRAEYIESLANGLGYNIPKRWDRLHWCTTWNADAD